MGSDSLGSITLSLRFLLYPLLSGKWVFIRTAILLSLLLGFLSYIYFAPMLNQYYILDPLEKATLGYLIDISISSHNPFIDVTELYREMTRTLLACMGNSAYLAVGSSLNYNENEVSLVLIGDNASIKLIAPDISLSSLPRRYDGIAVHEVTLSGYKKLNDSIEKYWLRVGGTKYLLRMYPAKSRVALLPANIIFVLFNDAKSREILQRSGGITHLIVKDEQVLKKAEKCLTNIGSELRKKGLGEIRLRVSSKKQIYYNDKKALFSTAMYQWMLLSATLALIVSFIVSIRESFGLASASSDLIGVLRLYGAPSYTLIAMGLATGISLYALTIIGALIVLKLVFKVLLPLVVLPPLAYIISSMRLVLLGIFALMLSAVVLGFVVYSRKRSLEELVAGGSV